MDIVCKGPVTAVCEELENLLRRKKRLLIAIDGRSGAGKTVLAAELAGRFGGGIIPMDDFFLPAAMRTAGRLAEPGGNVHYERFWQEIAEPLFAARQAGGELWPPVRWRRFDCRTGGYAPSPCALRGSRLLIVEGAYCMRPELQPLYDMSIFLDISGRLQKERIIRRNGEERYADFRDRWIPMEDRYIDCYGIRRGCTFYLKAQSAPDGQEDRTESDFI